ncbi:MAG: hypothetical protein R2729_27690 [Bryobacteraceae bacterium]
MSESEWTFAQRDPEDRMARLHLYSVIRHQDGRDIEFVITVKEYINPPDPAMHFYATADKQTNQSHAPFTPCGWGPTLLEALARCRDAVMQFPYEGE